MTVSSTTNRKSFTGDGVTTSFGTSPVVFFNSSELAVQVITTATGAATTLTENTNYTVSGGSGSTGTVNLAGGTSPNGAPTASQTLLIRRVLPLTQTDDFVNNDINDAEVTEDRFDKTVMQIQQLDEELGRGLVIPPAETATDALTTLPFDRASKFLAFDASKNPIASSGTTGTVPVSTFMETVLDDTSAADARTTLGAAASGAATGSGLTMATARLLGRRTASTGALEELTGAQAVDLLLTTRGDLVRRGAATSERFAIGTAGRVLQSDGSDPFWGGIASRSAAVATTSGTSVPFTGIPAGVSVVRIKLNGVSTNGTGIIGFQLGDSGGIEPTGYTSCGTQITNAGNPVGANQTAFFPITGSSAAAAIYYGVAEFRRLAPGSNTWVFTATVGRSDGPATSVGAGAKTLSDELTQIAMINTAADTFDSGQAAIEWEF